MLVLKSMGTALDEFAAEYDYNNDNVVDWKDYDILSNAFIEPYTKDGHTYSITGTQLYIDGQAATDKIVDINQDGHMTAGDLTSLINKLLSGSVDQTSGEFVGSNVIFCTFDPSDNKIKIGVDYDTYLRSGDNAIILELDPSPNVIYCNSWTNKLYRWNDYSNEMVPIDMVSRQEFEEKGCKQTFCGLAIAEVDYVSVMLTEDVQDINEMDQVIV